MGRSEIPLSHSFVFAPVGDFDPVIRATQHRADRHHDDLAQTIAFGWSTRVFQAEKIDSRVIVTLAKASERHFFNLYNIYCISLIVERFFGVGLRHLRKRCRDHRLRLLIGRDNATPSRHSGPCRQRRAQSFAVRSQSALRHDDPINSLDATHKAQFSELSEMKKAVSEMKASRALGDTVDAASENTAIANQLQTFVTTTNGSPSSGDGQATAFWPERRQRRFPSTSYAGASENPSTGRWTALAGYSGPRPDDRPDDPPRDARCEQT